MSARLAALFDARWVLRGALIVVAFFCYFRAISYAPFYPTEDLPGGVSLVSAFVPLWFWALLWGLSALLALAAVPKAWPGGSAGCAALSFIWSVGYTINWSLSLRGFDVMWWHGLPILGFTTDGSPASVDYRAASTYWTVVLLLGAGYILSRKAVDASKVLSAVSES